MPGRYSVRLDALSESVLAGPGETEPGLRGDVAARAAELGRVGEPATSVPTDVSAYVDKVALHAYKVVDSDIERLREAGYSEDAVFELTVSAAYGAAAERIDRGLGALRGDGG
jgi:alkylhydroperoxidase family enzyme